MKFAEVIGQTTVLSYLKRLADDGKLPHALLFCGKLGVGKLPTALALASYLLCKNHTAEHDSCNQCPQCAMLRHWEHPDLHFSFPVVKPSGSGSDHKMESDDYIKEWRSMLNTQPYITIEHWLMAMNAENQQATIGVGESNALLKKLSMKSSQGGYKVSIIWLPERMNGECANKLLKLLEEPPTQTVFILVSEEPMQLLETIRSRCQRIDFNPLEEQTIYDALVKLRHIDPNMATRIAHQAEGSWTKALEQLDSDNENGLFLDLFMRLMRVAYMRDIRTLKDWSNEVNKLGRERQRRMLDYFMRMLRENFVYNFQQSQLIYMTDAEEAFAKNFARFIDEHNVIAFAELFEQAKRDIGQNANANVVFFDLALHTIMLLKRDK